MLFDETKNDLLTELGIEGDTECEVLDRIIAGEGRYVRDLRVNLKNTLESEQFQRKEAYLIALAVAVNEKNDLLIEAFSGKAIGEGATEADVAETVSCASLLATNNVFYRFKHFVSESNDQYQNLPARLKMNLMARPVLGKELFELISLVVSAVNGCEMCVKAHEASVREAGGNEARIFDAVRLGAVVRGLALLLR